MTVLAPTTGLPAATRVSVPTPPSIGSVRPDEAVIEQVWTEAMAAGVPVSRRWLRRRYVAHVANGQADWDFGGAVLTYLTRRGESRAVDAAVGEQVAYRLTG